MHLSIEDRPLRDAEMTENSNLNLFFERDRSVRHAFCDGRSSPLGHSTMDNEKLPKPNFSYGFSFLSFLSKLFDSEILLIQCVCFSIAFFSSLGFLLVPLAGLSLSLSLSPLPRHLLTNICFCGSVYTGVASNFDSIYLCDQRCHLYIKKRTVVHTAANRQRHFCRTKWQRNAKCIASTAVVDRKKKPQYGPIPPNVFEMRVKCER